MSQLSVQLFTVRKHMKTPEQIRKTFLQLCRLGIKHIEVARVKFTRDQAKVIQEVCTDLGMTVGSTQIKYETILKDYETLVELHHMWGCHWIAVSVLPTKYILQGEAGIRKFAVLLNDLGERLSQEGLKLLYHHHHMEFARYGEKTGLDIIM